MAPREAKGRTSLRVNAADGARVTIRVFPHDARFVRDIERVLGGIGAEVPEPRLRDRLETSLRAWYPMLEVRERDDLADVDLDERLWYAMRDGRVGRPRERVDRLHAAMSDARLTSATTTAVMEQVRETLAKASRPRAAREHLGGDDGALAPEDPA